MKAFEGTLNSDSNCFIWIERLIHRESTIRVVIVLNDLRAGLRGSCDLSMNSLGSGFERQRATLSRGNSKLPHPFAIQFTQVKVDDDGCHVRGSFEWNGSGAQFTGSLVPFQPTGQHPLYEPQLAAPPRFTHTNWFDLPEVQPERPGAYQVVTNRWWLRIPLETSGARAERLSASPERYAYWDGAQFGPTAKSPARAEERYRHTKDFKRVTSPSSWRGLLHDPAGPQT